MVDYCLSGFCKETFEFTAKCLMSFGSQYQTKELLIWDTNLGVNRTTFEVGTSQVGWVNVVCPPQMQYIR